MSSFPVKDWPIVRATDRRVAILSMGNPIHKNVILLFAILILSPRKKSEPGSVTPVHSPKYGLFILE
jgi:hypothetical protein